MEHENVILPCVLNKIVKKQLLKFLEYIVINTSSNLIRVDSKICSKYLGAKYEDVDIALDEMFKAINKISIEKFTDNYSVHYNLFDRVRIDGSTIVIASSYFKPTEIKEYLFKIIYMLRD